MGFSDNSKQIESIINWNYNKEKRRRVGKAPALKQL